MHLHSFLGAILDGAGLEGNGAGSLVENSAFYKEIRHWIQFFGNRPLSFCHVIPTAFIFDYSTSGVIYISPSIRHMLGFEDKFFLGKNGIVKFIDLINPNDFKIYNEQIFPREMQLLSTVPHHETQDFVFSTTLRVNQKNGPSKTLLMKKGFIVNEHNKWPQHEFGTLVDISSVKKELSMTHTVERFEQGDDCATYTKVLSQDYFPDMDGGLLTAREREILTNLSLGTKRKEVGAKLFISDNTVANHIKAILRKTNSKNVREAIAICKMNGII